MNNAENQSSEYVVQVENISKSYDKVKADNGLSFTVKKGEIFGFLGPNGAGKTTTLSILEGLHKADSGQVAILGMDITTKAKSIKRRIGVQLQSTSLLPDLTVCKQIQLFARLYGYNPDKDEIMDLLQRVGLTLKASAQPDKLSGGQQQRLSLALALINQPEIIFLDEPTTGLDPQSRHALWDIIRELKNRGKTVVLTTHYMEEAVTLCDRVGIIDHGKLVALDTPGMLINSLAGFSTITTSANLLPAEIETLPSVEKIQHNGTQIILQTKNVVMTLRSIIDLAEQNNVTINDLQIKQPNLEDVFLNLTGRMMRN